MKTRSISVITKWILALVLTLALLPWVEMARAAAALDEQLTEAAKSGDLPLIKSALDNGAHVNARDRDGWTALIWATYYGHAEVVKLLIEKGANLNAKPNDGVTALMQAARYGHTEVVELLVANRADVNAEDSRGWTALRHATCETRSDAVKVLKAYGAEVTLIIAAILGDKEEVQRLIEAGADLDARDEEGNTALIEAIRYENADVVKVLVDKGADVNETDNGDNTALMMAVLTGQPDVVKLLIAKGADVNARNAPGWPVLSQVGASKHKEIVELLVKAGARDDWPERVLRPPTVTHAVKEKRRGEFLTGELVAYSRENLSIRLADPMPSVVVTVQLRSTTGFVPFRSPALGDNVQVRYREKKGTQVADQVRILSSRQIPRANGGKPQKNVSPYPDTPEGVVEAFLNAALRDVPVTVEEMRLCTEIIDVQSKYLPDNEDLESNRTSGVIDLGAAFWGPNAIRFHIATGFEIKEVTCGDNRATVKVSLKRLGWMHHVPFDIEECRSSRATEPKRERKPSELLEAVWKVVARQEGRAWDQEACRILHITNDTQEATYHLARPGKSWRIIDVYEPHISVRSAIKWLKCHLREIPGVQKAYPSQEQAIQIKDHIRTLESQLNN